MELRDKNGLTEAEFLAAYTPGDYPHPSLTADVAVCTEGEDGFALLLIRRGGHPFLGAWALPGGFVEEGENAQTAAKRELWEETGLVDLPLIPVGLFSDPGRDPRTWVVTQAYAARLQPHTQTPQAGDDAREAAWFTVTGQWQGRELSLTFAGPETFCARLTSREDGGYRMVDRGALAFDHAHVIARALKVLGLLPPKPVDYASLQRELEALVQEVPHPLANLSNAAALLYERLGGVNWAGFYRLEGDKLILGPFVGKPACIEIPLGRGVCGAAAREQRTQLVQNVHAFPGHIACDGASRSEIVVPLFVCDTLWGVLDIDSPQFSRFTQADKLGLEGCARILSRWIN
ncbi:MAG: NUDIX domain-containing protein [Clostridia bacterium]|nr:NUDIX domain-containing protein [Clostridia bacterium]